MNNTMEIQIGKDVILIDKEDYDKFNSLKWYIHGNKRANTTKYALANIKKGNKNSTIRLHRFILSVDTSKIQVDHINGNGLDNRKCNLRICNAQQNTYNQKPLNRYKGVIKYKDGYRASVRVEKKDYYLGFYNDEIEAALVVDAAIKFHHKDFAYLNFPHLDTKPKSVNLIRKEKGYE